MPRSLYELSSSLPVRLAGSVILLVAFAGLLSVFLSRSEPRVTEEEEQSQVVDSDRRQCEDELAGILEGIRPGRLGISSDRVTAVGELARWDETCGLSREDAAKLVSDKETIRKLLSGEPLDRTLSERFLPEDASHIRESLLARALVKSRSENLRSDIERILTLFDYATRYIALVPDEYAERIPLTPYEALLFGTGSAADRANTFASLLRQFQFDAVILLPSGAPEQWLVGVLCPGEGVLLFDCRLGLPIPSLRDDGTSAFPRVPASLTEVRSSDELLRALDAPGLPYPLKSADFEQIQVQLIGTSSVWAPRMAELQFLLPPGFDVELYDGLGNNELRSPGQFDRVLAAGDKQWTAAEMSLWSYPEDQLMRIEAVRGAEGTELGDLFKAFQGPYVPRLNPETQEVVNSVPYSLHAVRVQQLMGRHTEALKNLLPIRNAVSASDTAENRITADYATIWTGVSQAELGQYRAAFSTFARYAAGRPGATLATRSAVDWATIALVSSGKYEEAVLLLEQARATQNPHRQHWLVTRWRKLAGLSSTPADTPQTAPATQPAAEPESASPPKADPAPASEPENMPAAESQTAPAGEMPPESPSTPQEPAPSGESPPATEPAPPADPPPAEPTDPLPTPEAGSEGAEPDA